MKKKNNLKVLVLEIIVIVLAIVGVTLALTYVMDAININVMGANLAVNYTGNVTLPSVSLEPIADSEAETNTENVMKAEFSVKGVSSNNATKPIIYDVRLSDLEIDCELRKHLKWRLYKNNSVLYEGSFSPDFDVLKDNKIWLTEIQQLLPKSNETADSYKLLVWLSEACSDVTQCTPDDDQSNVFGKTISGKIEIILHTGATKELERETSSDSFSCPNSPDLVEGLVPITYSDNKWVKADSTNSKGSWYDYANKKWANAVLVSSSYRDANNDDTFEVGDEVPEDAILAYYVWIPRYKYKVWNINKVIGTDSYRAQTNGIDIVFESGTNTTGTIRCNNYSFAAPSSSANSPNETCSGSNGDYYTHPAFKFGNTELRGLWISKFEISSSSPTTSYGGGNSTSLTVRSKPNVNSWRFNYVTNFSYVIQNMSLENNEYGLKTDSNSHMLKNQEWGAVAYLTHSGYGRCSGDGCKEVALNSYSSYMTGCGPQSEGSTSSGITCNAYNTELGQLASTTGNIYGVYDMSGGAFEYVMGNMSSAAGSYTYYASNDGSKFTYSEDTAKYIDTYANGSSSNNQMAYNRARLGDATGEVANSSGYGWYGDIANFVYFSFSWLSRGYFSSSSNAGVFSFHYNNGYNDNYSARACLVGGA